MSHTFLNSILWPEGCKSNSKITNLRVQLQPSEEIIVITYQNPKTVEWITTKWFTTSQNRFRKLVVAVAAEVPEPEAVEEDKEEDDPGNQDHPLPCLTWQDASQWVPERYEGYHEGSCPSQTTVITFIFLMNLGSKDLSTCCFLDITDNIRK